MDVEIQRGHGHLFLSDPPAELVEKLERRGIRLRLDFPWSGYDAVVYVNWNDFTEAGDGGTLWAAIHRNEYQDLDGYLFWHDGEPPVGEKLEKLLKSKGVKMRYYYWEGSPGFWEDSPGGGYFRDMTEYEQLHAVPIMMLAALDKPVLETADGERPKEA